MLYHSENILLLTLSHSEGQGRGHMEGGHAPEIVTSHHQGELTLEEDQDHQEGEDLEVQEE